MSNEYIEMEATTSSGTLSSTLGGSISDRRVKTQEPDVKTVINLSYEYRTFTDRSISYCWVFIPVVLYFLVGVGGLMTCVSVGRVYEAFDEYCIFNASFVLINIDSLGNSTTLKPENVGIPVWGNKSDCTLVEYGSVACVIFGGIWIAMVLQCGRGGASRRGFRLPDAWRIVPPTCILNLIFLILSCIILSRLTWGFNSFCENIRFDGNATTQARNKSCSEILEYHFPQDRFNTDLLQEYRVSQIGALIQLTGCILGFLIVMFRCCTGPDFDLYERKKVEYIPANTQEHDEDEEDDDEDVTLTPTTVVCHENPTLKISDEDTDESVGSIHSRANLVI